MSARSVLTILLIFALVSIAAPKNKKKQVLPDYVLRAETILVVIHPDAGEPLTNPTANQTAQENVEKALTQWGRYRLVMDAQTADLIVAVRKGHANGPTVNNSPSDNRPVIIQPSDGNTRIGGQQGRPPDLTDPTAAGPANRGPRISNEIGPSDDTFEVYRGKIEYPLDSSPLWRYMARDALDGPQVAAVEQFRKVVIDSEKQSQQK